jgi:preprotein translocase subunit SecF
MEFVSKQTHFPFMATRKWWYLFSATILVVSLGSLMVRGLNFGIDFTGGVEMEMSFPQEADLQSVRDALAQAGFENAVVQSFGTPQEVLVRLLPDADENVNELGEAVLAAVRARDAGVELRRTELVGPQVGKELAEKGALAVLFTFLLILAYVAFRFQWKLGIGALVAAMHDPLLILGIFSLTQLTFDLATLAAILAVIGYSLNDTVVVFDRIRERFISMRKATSEQVIDTAINQTLSRTIITSGTTMLTVLALLFFGGEVLRGFATALAIGIVIGTYSSIYIASAIALDLGITAQDLLPVHKEKDFVDDMP